MDELAAALEIARAAGALLAEGQGRHHASVSKATAIDLVTEFDRRSEALIVGELRARFPGDAILAEESGLTAGGAHRRWLVDPLDGTTNFAHGLPLWNVTLALEVEGVVEVGVVFAPAIDLLFAARRGAGATCNGAAIHVSDENSLARALVVTGFPYDRQTSPDNNFAQFVAFQKRAQGVRRLGAAALDLAFVAQGALDGYWEMKLKPWDLAAGLLLVREAGGRATDWRGGEVALERGALVASNGAIHDEMLALLAATGIPPAAGA